MTKPANALWRPLVKPKPDHDKPVFEWHNIHMIQPPFLKSGDTIGIMAPSSWVSEDDLTSGADFLRAHGFHAEIHPQTYLKWNQSAGTTEQKRDAFHDLVSNDDIKAIMFAGGGNRALHLLEHLNFDLIRKHPKIYMGFSDCTAILNAIHARTGIITYHGPVVKHFAAVPQMEFNLRLLKGEETIIPMTGAIALHKGHAEGHLFGGNFSVIRRLIGSTEMPDPTGSILFLEDIGEETSRLDAELCFLRRTGLLDKLGGLIFGQFTDLQDTGRPFEFSFEEIVLEHTNGLKIPVLINAPFGHDRSMNYIMPIGQRIKLSETNITFL